MVKLGGKALYCDKITIFGANSSQLGRNEHNKAIHHKRSKASRRVWEVYHTFMVYSVSCCLFLHFHRCLPAFRQYRAPGYGPIVVLFQYSHNDVHRACDNCDLKADIFSAVQIHKAYLVGIFGFLSHRNARDYLLPGALSLPDEA